jgi:hypothetical protein
MNPNSGEEPAMCGDPSPGSAPGSVPSPLPGPCVAVPHVRGEVWSRDGAVRWEVETHLTPGLDLDGHGSPVFLVPSTGPNLHPDTMRWTLYLVRGGCGYELGVIDGLDDPTLEPGVSHGLRNISTLRPAWPQPNVRRRGNLILTRYTFDGQRYRAAEVRRR